MSLSPVLVTAPVEYPVSLAEARKRLRIDYDDDDTDLENAIATATEHFDGVNGILGRALVTQTWRQDFSEFSDALRLPLGPVTSITHVKYYDADGALQTLASSVYSLFVDSEGAYLELAPDQSWPSTTTRTNAVSVTFVCGSDASAVPAPIKQAILLMVGDIYAFRETAHVGSTASAVPTAVNLDGLVAKYRKITL
jgi:uncharacterized phiE125 gp8 family phage protein